MIVELCLDWLSNQWILRVLQGAHNHGASAAITAHPVHRMAVLTPETRTEISRLSQVGFAPGQILTTLRLSDSQTPLVVKDIGTMVQQFRAEELNGRTPIQWLLEVSIKLF
jgi:hypothetical protein